MRILELKEHTSCYNYANSILEGFSYCKLQAGETYEKESNKNHILFVLQGVIEFYCKELTLQIKEGNMICFHCESKYKICSVKSSRITIALFENTIQSCEKISFEELYELNLQKVSSTVPLEIRHKLYLFLELMIKYLEDGASCFHFHEIKLRELFWILRFYYTKTELATFFHPILGNEREFRKAVLDNYENAKTVKELSTKCGLSLSSFKRRFANEFREPVSQWIQKQKNKTIKYKLADEDIPIGEIAFELDFSSLPQFCRYCKRNFGYTPGEYRKILKSRHKKI